MQHPAARNGPYRETLELLNHCFESRKFPNFDTNMSKNFYSVSSWFHLLLSNVTVNVTNHGHYSGGRQVLVRVVNLLH